MSYLPFFLNCLLVPFWIRLWTRPGGEFSFNPFVTGITRFSDRPVAFLRPGLPLPEKALAFLLLAFLFLFKTLVLLRSGMPFSIEVGKALSFRPPAPPDGPPATAAFFLFSGIDTLFFFLRLWAVFWFIRLITPGGRDSRAFDAFSFLARPFSRLSPLMRAAALAALAAGAAALLSGNAACSAHAPPAAAAAQALPAPAAGLFTEAPLPLRTLRTVWLAFLTVADGLDIINRALFAAILGNILSALFGWRRGALFCEECTGMIMGRFARRVLVGGGVDITPILFFLAVNLIHTLACGWVAGLIRMPGELLRAL